MIFERPRVFYFIEKYIARHTENNLLKVKVKELKPQPNELYPFHVRNI